LPSTKLNEENRMSLEPSAQPEPTPAPATAEQPVTPPPLAETAAPDTAITTAPAAAQAVAVQSAAAEPLTAEELKKVRRVIHPGFPRKVWRAAVGLTLLTSMAINLILIVVVVILVNQVGAIKMTLASVLGQLDSAFEGLGAASIQDTIKINQQVPVQFDLPLNQNTTVTTLAPVPINTQANFSLGPFGNINGVVSLQLPTGTQLPVHLELMVPISNSIPVVFDQAINIPLAERGLGPVVAKLRSALGPLIKLVGQLPERFVIVEP
jgi:hypothetical protein